MEKDFEKKLTNREFEVLKLMVKGVSNTFIANALNITEATAKAHVSRIFEKLKVLNRVQAVVLAIKNEII